ncbi:MAG: trypsin-like peptidase domain-containing protein, partial [bacterium]
MRTSKDGSDGIPGRWRATRLLATVLALASCAAAAAVRSSAAPPAAAIPAAVSTADADGLERSFVDVADRVGPAVVSIVATTTYVMRGSPWGDESMDEFFRHFFEIPQMEQRQQVMSAGSGVIVTADGYVLTNAHVIGQAKNIVVKLLNKKEYKAKIVGKDDDTDLAVLKIKAEGTLATAPLGDSDRIRVGQWSIAIGNPFALENTVTVGVISAKGRQLDNGTGGRTARFTSFIQTDASINRGNSGGPLLNIRGEVIGINTMIYSPSGGSVGIGFAIPINIAKRVMDGLIKEGRIIRPQLGIAYGPLQPEVAKKLGLPAGQGMEVSGVLKGTGAEQAGLKPGDIILAVDGKPLREREELRAIVLAHKGGDTIRLDVQRKGKRIVLDVAL